jgi:stress-induced morphogen
MSDRVAEIESRLRAAFDPDEILVKDQSHLHAGHAGARDGKGHFEVRIVSNAFAGHNRVSRHRMIYDALGDLMQTDIHALSINAIAPGDA